MLLATPLVIDASCINSHNQAHSLCLPEHAMTTIRQQDFIDSIADALQFISPLPRGFVRSLAAAISEELPAAKDAMAQILSNSRMCAQGYRPVCRTPARVARRGDGCALGKAHEHRRDGERGCA
jgi:hypothetical protein